MVTLLCKAQFWGNLFISETLKSNAKNIAVLTAAQRANMLTSDYVVSWEGCRRTWGMCVRVSEPMDTHNPDFHDLPTVYILIETFDEIDSPQFCQPSLMSYTYLFTSNLLIVCLHFW
jgi:hypothetical protein